MHAGISQGMYIVTLDVLVSCGRVLFTQVPLTAVRGLLLNQSSPYPYTHALSVDITRVRMVVIVAESLKCRVHHIYYILCSTVEYRSISVVRSNNLIKL